MQPILPDLWTTTVVATVVLVNNPETSKKAKIYVIGYYGKPDELEPQETLLKNFVDHIHSIETNPHIVIAGDFNKQQQAMKNLTLRLNCWLAQNSDRQIPTHFNAAKQRSSQLDYIVTNGLFENTTADESYDSAYGNQAFNITKISDHWPISTMILVNHEEKAYSVRRGKFELRLKAHLTNQQIALIYKHPQWPRRPFIIVAKLLGLTMWAHSK